LALFSKLSFHTMAGGLAVAGLSKKCWWNAWGLWLKLPSKLQTRRRLASLLRADLEDPEADVVPTAMILQLLVAAAQIFRVTIGGASATPEMKLCLTLE
jgi:hypothetical protein